MKYVIDAEFAQVVTVQGDDSKVYLSITESGGYEITAPLSTLDVTELTFALNRCKEGVRRL